VQSELLVRGKEGIVLQITLISSEDVGSFFYVLLKHAKFYCNWNCVV